MEPSSGAWSYRWLYALKFASWPKLLVPALLGQGIGVATSGFFDLRAYGVGMGLAVSCLVGGVLLNDWKDQRVDGLKREMFGTQCSPQTIPDGILSARAVFGVGLLATLVHFALSLYAADLLARPLLPTFSLLALGLLAAYSFPPLRLNYRGGGEWVEMLGAGVLIPASNAYLQSGEFLCRGILVLPGFALLCLAVAIAAALGDEVSDRVGGKRTVVTVCGNDRARQRIELLTLAGALAWAVAAVSIGGPLVLRPLAALPVGILLLNWRRIRRISPYATTNNFESLTRYQDALHMGVWRAALAFGVVMAALAWSGQSLG